MWESSASGPSSQMNVQPRLISFPIESVMMSSPQLEDGYTRIANEVLEAICRLSLSPDLSRVMWTVIRKTWGFGKKSDAISLGQFALATGMRKPHVSRALSKLQKMNIIIQTGNDKRQEWLFNKHHDLWKPLPKQVTLPKQVMIVTQAGNESLPKQVKPPRDTSMYSKENMKETIQKKDHVLRYATDMSPGLRATCPHREIIDLYNATLPMLPAVQFLTENRRRALRGRWQEDAERQELIWWKDFFLLVAKSDFLCGRTNGRDWKADFDWLIKPANIIKILEGKYDNHESGPGRHFVN